jgi:myo-inositol-1(or 4)-monophosphatase
MARLAAAVREAGSVALSYFRGPLKTWTKGEAQSPVTEADIASNDLLRTRLVAPGDGWLSEESENDPARLGARRSGIVDPVDGTRAFMAGREDWSVSVALVEAGRPVVAALFAPATDEMFVAGAGGGAARSGARIRANVGGGLDGARIGGPKRMLDRMALQVPPIVPMPRVHSLALRFARVADGALDVAIAGGNSHDWDLAAADLLVHEAGGVMTALDGRVPIYTQPEPAHGILIAGGRGRYAAVIDLIRTQTNGLA